MGFGIGYVYIVIGVQWLLGVMSHGGLVVCWVIHVRIDRICLRNPLALDEAVLPGVVH